jgi:hypothetical protein
MTIRIDVSRALTTHEELAALVHAVLAAQPEDELDWIEWKIAGDLSKRSTQGIIARHILGLANRLPDRAVLHAGGWGYLIMGAQPGSAPGITKVAPALLGQGVQSWLGSDGPAWWPHYDEELGVPVLVVKVAPPQSGQRAFTLRKDLTVTPPGGGSKGYAAGTIFIRHPGRTEIAGPGDIRVLEDRYAAPALESARAAEANARRSLEIQQERQAAEELERRRVRLMEIADLVINAQFKPLLSGPAATTSGAPNSSSFRLCSLVWTTRRYGRRCQRSRRWPAQDRGLRPSLPPSALDRKSRQPCGSLRCRTSSN